ncbi:hypothetical protein Salat_1821200 [Sesamum alatum]|uniref:Uncharacterized protein n=1 Tax=Sesamum alatum TaxID=300844 RepID=A0AAE2CHM6_9LAMI|nr:hypothetical protein Salat_1821200 [Sesamum alatum]
MADAAGYEDPDEWEIVNDDGFVHKRKRRRPIDPSATSSSGYPELGMKHVCERKKRVLLKLRAKYFKEISRWELLSNTLTEMDENAHTRLLELQVLCPTTFINAASSSEQHSGLDSTCRRIVDDLFSQAEGQEAIIRDVLSLCDVAEALCSTHEERLKQQLTNLPIWGPSPHELMAALETTASFIIDRALHDAIVKPRYLFTFTVYYDQIDNTDAAIKKERPGRWYTDPHLPPCAAYIDGLKP